MRVACSNRYLWIRFTSCSPSCEAMRPYKQPRSILPNQDTCSGCRVLWPAAGKRSLHTSQLALALQTAFSSKHKPFVVYRAIELWLKEKNIINPQLDQIHNFLTLFNLIPNNFSSNMETTWLKDTEFRKTRLPCSDDLQLLPWSPSGQESGTMIPTWLWVEIPSCYTSEEPT